MSNTHRNFLELLPWYVNGTLSDRDRGLLRAHLGECLPCHAAYREELRLHRLLEEQGAVPLAQDRGLSDLLQQIDRVNGRRESAGSAARWRSFAVAGVATAMIVAGIAALWPESQGPASGEGEFSTLFGESSAGSRSVDVIFAEPPSADELARFLDEVGGIAVGGPTDLGRYTIELAAERDPDVLVEDLKSNPRIRFAGRAFSGDAAVGEAGR